MRSIGLKDIGTNETVNSCWKMPVGVRNMYFFRLRGNSPKVTIGLFWRFIINYCITEKNGTRDRSLGTDAADTF